jgi:PAS domain S-box-containing protein
MIETRLLSALVDHLQVGVFALDNQGRIVLWNAEAERLTGHLRGEALGADALSLGIAPSDQAASKEIMSRLLAGESWSGEFPIHGAGGRPAFFRTVPVLGEAGELVAVVSVFYDNTERRTVEETLALLDGLFENAPVGFTYVDTELRYRRVNTTVATMNGGTATERLGRTIGEVHGDPCGPQFSAACREVIRTGRARQVRIEGRLWHGRGPHQVWRMNFYPVFGEDGAVVGVGNVFIDVTDAEQTHRELAGLARSRRQALTRYQSLIEATSAAVWTLDANGALLSDADGHLQASEGFLAAAHPQDRAGAQRRWQLALAAGAHYDQVLRLRSAGGGYRHSRVRAVPVVIGGQLTEWIATHTDVETEIRARTRLELLAKATEAVNRELEPIGELHALADVLVPAFADGATIHLLDPPPPEGPVTGRQLLSRVTLDVLNAAPEQPFSYPADHPFAEVVRTRQPLLLQHPLQTNARWARETALAEWEHKLGWHTSILAPIRSGATVLAVLTFIAWGDRPPFVAEDLAFVGELAARASAAVEHARRFEEARRAALTLQQALLTRLPHRTDVQIEARYQPALANLQVGGDWYDAFTLPGGDLALVVGDVVGHDLHAATVMGQLRSMFRAIAMDDTTTPAAAIQRLNDLAISLDITHFTTVVYARLTPEADGGATLAWCSAGHPPPMVTVPDQPARSLTGGESMVIGVQPGGATRHTAQTRLPPGSTLLLYTDGLVERRTIDLDEMTTRLATLATQLAETSLPTFCDQLLAGGLPDTRDDIALLGVRLQKPDPAQPNDDRCDHMLGGRQKNAESFPE